MSTLQRDVSIGSSRSVTSVIMPVSPMPPAVAQKTSGCSLGEHSSGPDGVREAEPDDVRADGALAVVVLAVDVARDGAPDRDEARPGRHRDEEAPRHDHLQQRVDRAARLDAHDAGRVVELEDPVEPGAVEQRAAGALGGVAVAAPEPSGEQRPRPGGELGELGRRPRPLDVGRRGRGPAPAGDELDGARPAHE